MSSHEKELPHKKATTLSIFVKPLQILVPLVKTSILAEGIKNLTFFPRGILLYFVPWAVVTLQ
jgi:hypothetical protein